MKTHVLIKHLNFVLFLSPFHLNLQVAIIAGNFDLAEIIKVHKVSDVGKLTAFVQLFKG